MSRRIAPKASVSVTEEEREARRADKGKLLATVYRGRRCALLIQGDRLTEASFFSEDGGQVGAIYIGKVKNLAKNMDACFVEIGGGEICFLQLKNAAAPWLLNRACDGRILEGDELLVQVVRDAQKGKRASVTAHISLANECFVLAMGDTGVGYSSKLSKEQKTEVRRLFRDKALFDLSESRDCLTQDPAALLPGEKLAQKRELPPTGLIIRTKAGEWESSEALLRQFYTLAAQYVKLLYAALHRSCFSCLREADSDLEAVLAQFVLRNSPGLEIVTDQADLYEKLAQGGYADIRLYKDEMLPLSALYSIEKKLAAALERRVWLKSGAYLVIEHTEALTVIDVNSGKCEAGRASRETYLGINLEAAEEVARQLRLRNLSGIILVDFINMQFPEDKRALLHSMKELVAGDPVPTKVVDMTALGLVEITRKKINRTLLEQFLQREKGEE